MLYQVDGQLSDGPNNSIASDTEDTIPGTRYFAVLASTTRYRYPITSTVRTLEPNLEYVATGES